MTLHMTPPQISVSTPNTAEIEIAHQALIHDHRPPQTSAWASEPEEEGNAIRGIVFALPICLIFWGGAIALFVVITRSSS